MLTHQTQASLGTGHDPELVSWTWTILSVETGTLELPELSPVFGTNVGVPCDGALSFQSKHNELPSASSHPSPSPPTM